MGKRKEEREKRRRERLQGIRESKRQERGPKKSTCQIEGHEWPDIYQVDDFRIEGAILPKEWWSCGRCGFRVYQLAKPSQFFPFDSTTKEMSISFVRTREREGVKESMADVSIRDLKRAARELNNSCGLKPPINLLADEEELTKQLREASQCLEPEDFEEREGQEPISNDTKATLEALDIDLPKPKGEKKVEREEKKEEKEETRSSKRDKKEESVPRKKKEEKEAEKPAKAKKETKKESKKTSPKEDEALPAGYVRAEEAAKMLGFDEKRQVRILARKGKLPSKKQGTRVLFKVTDLEKYKAKMKAEKNKKSDD
jgi:excisionase family DNA binding protein